MIISQVSYRTNGPLVVIAVVVDDRYINRIHHCCSVEKGQFQPVGPTFQWETRFAEFPTGTWTRRLELLTGKEIHLFLN